MQARARPLWNLLLVGTCAQAVACGRDERTGSPATPQTQREARYAPARSGRTDLRDVPGDLDALAAALAASSACARLRGQYRVLPPVDSDAASGTLWVRDCVPTMNGNSVTFAIDAQAWEWIGGHLDSVGVSLRVAGYLSVLYEPSRRVITAAFEPGQPAVYTVLPRGRAGRHDERMDTAILGALAMALAEPRAPVRTAPDLDPRYGVVASIPVCDPVPQFRFQGEPTPSATAENEPIELVPGAPAFFGPLGSRGELDLGLSRGSVHVAAVCATQARTLASAFVAGRALPRVPVIVERDLTSSARIDVPVVACPVVVMMRAVGQGPGRERATVEWRTRAGAAAISMGPLRCTPAGAEPALEPAP